MNNPEPDRSTPKSLRPSLSPTCPDCGAPLPPAAPAGMCPKCLLQAGLAGSQEAISAAETADRGEHGVRFAPPSIAELQAALPQLELLALVGRGGMGVVYQARQAGLDRLVAVKILPPEISGAPGFAERFTREARALAKLNHPNIVAVHDVGRAGTLYYFVMEFVDGVNLRQALQAGQIAPEQALSIVTQVCDALQYAHDEGVVHRDIKPENILLDKRGRVKIADFGLAKLLSQEPSGEQLTSVQQVMGTPRYMAPEQMEGARNVDHRADIFSLGVVFYELLTGELPVGRFALPSQKVQVDMRLDEVVLRTLEKEPALRYQRASEVKTAIEATTTQLQVPSPGAREPAEAAPLADVARLTVLAASGALGGVTVAAGIAMAIYATLFAGTASGQFWGWLSAAAACLAVGAAGAALAFAEYRRSTHPAQPRAASTHTERTAP